MAAAQMQKSRTSKCLAIIFSTGDIGDVGRHAVLAALELPPEQVATVKVFSSNTTKSLLQDRDWKCGCDAEHSSTVLFHHHRKNNNAKKSQEQVESPADRLQLFNVDCTRESLCQYLTDVDAVISCLGNRQPFHPECIAKSGISEDWPPMEWSREGQLLQGFFRTICWKNYQDLSGAELAVQQGAQISPELNYLIARTVLLGENTRPGDQWYIQQKKYQDHPEHDMSKMDCARFMVQEATHPTIHRSAVVVGGVPTPSAPTAAAQRSVKPHPRPCKPRSYP